VKALALAVVLLAGCARLDVPSIGLHEWIIPGDQAAIDAGHVVRVDLPGIWLAGHRTDVGGVFRNVPNMRLGDVVCIDLKVCWHVARIMVVAQSWHPPPEGLGPLVLQTSWPVDRVLLVVCE
jgi:hypothetical protein